MLLSDSVVPAPALLSETPTHLDITRKDGTVLRVFFDAQDYPLISQYRWYLQKGGKNFYALANVRTADGKRTTIRMHRLLLSDVSLIDHKDGNGLNNRRSNLRPATHAQNQHNQRKQARATASRFKGVSKHRNIYRARIRYNDKELHLGCFATEEEAALAYNEAAKKLHGEFARLNDVTKQAV